MANINLRDMVSLKAIKCVLYGVGAALLLMLVLSFFAALIVHIGGMLDRSLYICAILVEIIAVFGGAYLAAHLHGSRGLMMGLACGLLVFVLMLIFGGAGIISPWLKLLYCTIAGMAGGFLGIK
ncbi:MAG: TIGR04086 family membrane protein [Clostridia bacterium]|nr:TIGR04086 family membrane protein [Clostridia bacterium]